MLRARWWCLKRLTIDAPPRARDVRRDRVRYLPHESPMPKLLEDILFPVYVALGPVLWGFLAIGLFMGRQRMNRLRRPGEALPNPAPHVTILIPAKDEQSMIGQCLESILKLDYPSFDVIAIDDRSTDRTGAIMDDIATRTPRISVLHIAPGSLPAGWFGKCHALNAGAESARGDWLLFVDADVTLQPDALRVTLALAEEREYDALSILTRLTCDKPWERLILPLAAAAWSMLHTVSLTNSDTRKHIAVANGQFMLIRRSTYESVGGHEAVKSEIVEDVELFRLIKSREFRTRLLMGRDFGATRMYDDLGRMFHGWARIFSGTARRSTWRIIVGMLVIVLGSFSAYPALAWGAWRLNHHGASSHTWGWLANAAVHFMLMTTVVALIYRFSGNARRWALAFPLAGAMLLAIFGFSLVKCFTGRSLWRGTTYESNSKPQWTMK